MPYNPAEQVTAMSVLQEFSDAMTGMASINGDIRPNDRTSRRGYAKQLKILRLHAQKVNMTEEHGYNS